MKSVREASVVGLVALVATTPAEAWLAEGHRILTLEALTLLPAEVPRFLQVDAERLAWSSIDPDLMRHRDLPQLRDREATDHYLDLELLQGDDLPELRSELIAHLARREGGPNLNQVGALPYAVVESTQRLIVAFAMHRQQPRDSHLQAKVRVYAALVAHYAADLCQPLHTTIHHDGRALEDGTSPYTGIHRRVDDLIGRLNPQDGTDLELGDPPKLDPLFPSIVEELEQSHSEVDRVYDLELDLAALDADGEASDRLVAFTRDRYRAAVLLTARLILTAWRQSENLDLPDWGLRGPGPAD